jgi:hypothetical protein
MTRPLEIPRSGVIGKLAATPAAGDWCPFPVTTNGPCKGICRSAGFRFAGEQDVTFAGRVIRTSHWVINPCANLT